MSVLLPNSYCWSPVLDIKIDDRQMTFDIKPSLMPIARCVLYKRYSIVLAKTPKFSVQWTDEQGPPLQTFDVPDKYSEFDNLPFQIPSQLFKTTIRVYHECDKLMTITLYYTTNRVLAQGNYCAEWRGKEFRALVALINTLDIYLDKGQVQEARQSIQLLQIPPASPQLATSPAVNKKISKQAIRRSRRLQGLQCDEGHSQNSIIGQTPSPTSPPCLNVTTVASTPSSQFATSNEEVNLNGLVEILEPATCSGPSILENEEMLTTKDISPSRITVLEKQGKVDDDANPSVAENPENTPCIIPVDEKDWVDVDVNAPRFTFTKRNARFPLRRHTPGTKPFSLGQTKKSLKLMQHQITSLQASIKSCNNFIIEQVETAKVQVKTSVKVHIEKKLQLQSDLIESLATRITDLENQNKILKSQLGDLKKQLSDKNKSQCNISPPVNTSLTAMCCETANQTPPSTSVTAASTVTTQNATRNVELVLPSSAEVMAQSTLSSKPIPRLPPSSNTMLLQMRDETASSKKEASASFLRSPPLNDASSTHLQKATASSRPSSSVHLKMNAKSSSPTHVPLTPRQQLAEERVKTTTSHLILGDSVVKFIRPDLVYPHSKRTSQLISVSGLAVDDVKHWLKHIPPCKNVQQLILHIGVNTCFSDVVTVAQWNELYKLSKKIFPNAFLHFSSILPPKAISSPLAKTVAESNVHLNTMCSREGCDFINNIDSFATNRGLPKKAAYQDNVHPSRVGTGRLGSTFRRAIQTTDTSSCVMASDQESWRQPRMPLLETPTKTSTTLNGPSWTSQLFNNQNNTAHLNTVDNSATSSQRSTNCGQSSIPLHKNSDSTNSNENIPLHIRPPPYPAFCDLFTRNNIGHGQHGGVFNNPMLYGNPMFPTAMYPQYFNPTPFFPLQHPMLRYTQ